MSLIIVEQLFANTRADRIIVGKVVLASRINKTARERRVKLFECNVNVDELLDTTLPIWLESCTITIADKKLNRVWTKDRKMEKESRERQWKVLLPSIEVLNREALVDLCLYVTQDAPPPAGVDKEELFERTTQAALIDGLCKRHTNFKDITEDFRAWQDERMRKLEAGEIRLKLGEHKEDPTWKARQDDWMQTIFPCLEDMSNESLEDFCSFVTGYDVGFFKHKSTQYLVGHLREHHFKTASVFAALRVWQHEKKVAKHTKNAVNVDADYSEMELRSFHHFNTVVQGMHADAQMHAMAAEGKLSNKTTLEKLGKLTTAQINEQLNRGAKPAYAETSEAARAAREEAEGHANSFIWSSQKTQRLIDLSEEDVASLHEDMKKHAKSARDGILKQTEKYYQRITGGLGVPQSLLLPKVGSPMMHISKKRKPNFMEHPSYVWKPADKIENTLKDLSETKERGFPVFEGVTNVPEKLTSTEAPPEPLEVELWTRSDNQQSRYEDFTRRHEYEMSIQCKKDHIKALQAEVEEAERDTSVGSPSSLSDWLRKPMGSF